MRGRGDLAPGFGGTEVEDPQRGKIIYYLDQDIPDNRLTTRASTLVAPHPATFLARNAAVVWSPYETLSIVDIPMNAPLGVHTLYARHEAVGGQLGNSINVGQIEILPHVVGTVTGQSTPFSANPIQIANSAPYRAFLERDLQKALRIVASKEAPVQARTIALNQELLEEEIERGALHLPVDAHTMAYALVRIAESFPYADMIAGEKPDLDKAVEIVKLMLR